MRRFNYSPRLASGTVAAGGTLAFLIPPSLGFVVYGCWPGIHRETPHFRNFPGLILAAAYIGILYSLVKLYPDWAPLVAGTVSFGRS